MAAQRPVVIHAFWDDQDPRNEGWAWRAYYIDSNGDMYYESGPFDGTARLSDRSIVRRTRAAAGWIRSRVPVEIH